MIVPLLIFNGLALVVTDGGWWVFWMALVSSLTVGAFSIFSAEWRLWTKIATMVVYLPVMAILPSSPDFSPPAACTAVTEGQWMGCGE